MARRRGFLAELQHQAAMAEKQRQRQASAAVQEQVRLEQEAERAQRASDRARAEAAREETGDLAAAEREAERAYVEAQEARVAAMNAQLQVQLGEIDGLLAAALEADGFVDLNALRQGYEHPPSASEQERREREAEVDRQNAELDELMAGLARGDASVVDRYVDIVLANSVYPQGIEVGVEHEFDGATKELRLTLLMPEPDRLPTVREYQYFRAKDEIIGTKQALNEQKERYANFLHCVALRTLHEVWEADRDGKIRSISLTAGLERIDRAPDEETVAPLLAIAVQRADFLKMDLTGVAHSVAVGEPPLSTVMGAFGRPPGTSPAQP